MALLITACFSAFGQDDLGVKKTPPIVLGYRSLKLAEHMVGEQPALRLTESQVAQVGTNAVRSLSFISLRYTVVVSAEGRVETAIVDGQTSAFDEEGRQLELAHTFKPWVRDGKAVRVTFQDSVRVLPPEQWGPSEPFPPPGQLRAASITLTRTQCYGGCAAYKLTVSADGDVDFRGSAYVTLSGEHHTRISAAKVQELLDAFRHADFMSARDVYRASISDCPTVTLSLSTGSATKTVVDYAGAQVGMPAVVQALERQVDEVAGTARWITLNEETLPALTAEHWDFSQATAMNSELYSIAVRRGLADLTDRLLQARAPVLEISTAQGIFSSAYRLSQTPLCIASEQGNVGLVARMFAQVKTVSKEVANACLTAAAGAGSVAVAEFWIAHGADAAASPKPPPDGRGWSDRTPVVQAVASARPEVLRLLLAYQPDVNVLSDGETLLRLAINSSDGDDEAAGRVLETISLLLSAGTDINAAGRDRKTAVFAASSSAETLKLLLKAGADINARDSQGQSALFDVAYREGSVRNLLESGIDPTLTDDEGKTALNKAQHCTACRVMIEQAIAKRQKASDKDAR